MCVCVVEKWRTEIFSWADGSFSNLFIAFNGKSSVKKGWGQKEREREGKEETKPEDGKHTYTQWKTRQTTWMIEEKVKSMMPTWILKTTILIL
jgi:hypothetical protein